MDPVAAPQEAADTIVSASSGTGAPPCSARSTAVRSSAKYPGA